MAQWFGAFLVSAQATNQIALSPTVPYPGNPVTGKLFPFSSGPLVLTAAAKMEPLTKPAPHASSLSDTHQSMPWLPPTKTSKQF